MAPSESSKESTQVGHVLWQDEAGLGLEGEGGWAVSISSVYTALQ